MRSRLLRTVLATAACGVVTASAAAPAHAAGRTTVADTQQVAFQLALLSSFLPTLMLSGFIFPIASMPAVLQGITYIVPARYFLVALRGIVLKGVGPAVVWPDFLALSIFAAVVLTLASIRLRRQWT